MWDWTSRLDRLVLSDYFGLRRTAKVQEYNRSGRCTTRMGACACSYVQDERCWPVGCAWHDPHHTHNKHACAGHKKLPWSLSSVQPLVLVCGAHIAREANPLVQHIAPSTARVARPVIRALRALGLLCGGKVGLDLGASSGPVDARRVVLLATSVTLFFVGFQKLDVAFCRYAARRDTVSGTISFRGARAGAWL